MVRTTRLALVVALACACAEGSVTGDPAPDADASPEAAAPDLPPPDAPAPDVAPPDVAPPPMDAAPDVLRPDAAPDAAMDAVMDAPAEAARPDVSMDATTDAAPDVRDVASEPTLPATDVTWATSAMAMACMPGARYRYRCPARGTLAPCWGTDVYTHDSSVCSAAVHAGRVTVDDGGEVTFEMRAGAAGYIGSTRHGVTSLSTGSWPCSIAFP
ncbi:MAG: LCCL domain-containing protein [Polyangiales bacterium]